MCEHIKRDKIRNENIGKKTEMVSMKTEIVQKCEKEIYECHNAEV